jgi:Domain of unknown function (DUF1707)
MPVRGTRGSGARQRTADATMRVSDAERAEVADQLAQHYGDGRLDQADLDERLGRAMSAKTRADLTGITDDLPEVGTRPAARISAYPGRALPPASRPRRQWPKALAIVLLIVVVSATWHGLVSFWPWSWFGFGFGPWLWIVLLAFCWLRFGPRRHHQ